MTRRATVLLAAAALLVPGSAGAQEPPVTESPDPTSVALVPSTTRPDDPHNGTWFVMTLLPGESGQQSATIVNPANVPQTVDLAIRGVTVEDGTLRLLDGDSGLGAWGEFAEGRVTVPPRDRIRVPFTITVPESGVEARDHLGAAVATTTAQVAGATVVQQVATRIFVTVPGEAASDFEVVGISTTPDSRWWPRNVLVTVTLRNVGEIRVAPDVTVAGVPARGPRFLLAGTEEAYVVDLPAPLVAGSVAVPVDVSDDTGVVRRVDRSTVVVRWGFVLAALLVAAAGWLSVRWWRRHESRMARLEADFRRLERLVASTRGVELPGDAVAADHRDGDRDHRFHAALKRARRTSDNEGLARLALERHATTGDALPVLVEALKHRTELHPDVARAAASYGPGAVHEALRTASLPDSTERMLRALTEAEAKVRS